MRFRERVAQFFYGRYGIDSLYYGLLVSILILWVLRVIFASLTPVSIIIYILETVLLFWMLYRCLSRNISARRHENEIFTSFWKKIKNFFILQKTKSGILKSTATKNVLTAKRCCVCQSGRAPIP